MTVAKHNAGLPANIQEIVKEVLIGRDRLDAIRAAIRVAKKANKPTLDAMKAEGREYGERILDYEVSLAEYFRSLPKASGGDRKSEKVKIKSSNGATFDFECALCNRLVRKGEHHLCKPTYKPEKQKKLEMVGNLGFTRDEVIKIQQLTPESVEKAKATARENNDIPTRSLALQIAKKEKKEAIIKNKREKKTYEKPDDLKDCKLFTADINNQIPEIPDNSVDFIITDPPYPKEYIPLYGQLSRLAKRVLKQGGSLIVMCGQSYLPDVIKELSRHMEYHWTLAYMTPGGQSPQLWQKKTNTFWKPVLWYTSGKYIGDLIGDVLKSPPNDNDKQFHEWGQSLAGFKEIIEKFTYPGQTILDPFLGGGTTGAAVVSMGRKFIGIDIEKKNIDISRERIRQCLK
jgi:site-specific DNA-methyltransferase (adenine-specific)